MAAIGFNGSTVEMIIAYHPEITLETQCSHTVEEDGVSIRCSKRLSDHGGKHHVERNVCNKCSKYYCTDHGFSLKFNKGSFKCDKCQVRNGWFGERW